MGSRGPGHLFGTAARSGWMPVVLAIAVAAVGPVLSAGLSGGQRWAAGALSAGLLATLLVMWCRWQQAGVRRQVSDLADALGRMTGAAGIPLPRSADPAMAHLLDEIDRLVQRCRDPQGGEQDGQSRMRGADRAAGRTAGDADALVAAMSHELRTPLTDILGLTEVLEEQAYGPLNARQLGYLRTISDSGGRLLATIGDILDLSRIDAGQLHLEQAAVPVDALCGAALDRIRGAARDKGVQLRLALPADAGSLLGDVQRLGQVLDNLLENAVRYTPGGGRVELAVGRADGRVRISVLDNGIGIAAADQGRLFEPLQDRNAGWVPRQGGIGLGLTLVQRLVVLHRGEVRVRSRPGQGTRVTLDLPAAHETRVPPTVRQAPAPPPMEPPDPGEAPLSARVLLAEDNATNAEIVCEYLGASGLEVSVAQDGEEALREARRSPPDLVLMDIQMPRMDGIQTIRAMRADPRLADIPIVALTALVMPGDRERCLAAGADDYVTKPVYLRGLLRTLRKHLGRVAAGRAVSERQSDEIAGSGGEA